MEKQTAGQVRVGPWTMGAQIPPGRHLQMQLSATA